jgi:hypothetical protein
MCDHIVRHFFNHSLIPIKLIEMCFLRDGTVSVRIKQIFIIIEFVYLF